MKIDSAQFKAQFIQVKARLAYFATHYTWAFVIVMTISIISCAFSVAYLSRLESDLTDVYENEIRGQDYIQSAYTTLLSLENEIKNLIIYSDIPTRKISSAAIVADIKKLRDTINQATPRFYTPAGKQIIAKSKKDMERFLGTLDTAVDRLSESDTLDREILQKLTDRKERLEADFNHLIANKTANSKVGYAGIIMQLRISLLVTIGILLVNIIIRVFMYKSGKKKQ